MTYMNAREYGAHIDAKNAVEMKRDADEFTRLQERAGLYYNAGEMYHTRQMFGQPVRRYGDADSYEAHDMSRGIKVMEIPDGLLYADESGEYFIQGFGFWDLLAEPTPALAARVPV